LSAKKINVLIVDDHLIVRAGIRMMLDTTDDIVIANEAESAEEALPLIEKNLFDESHPNLPILMLSMHSEEVYSSRALKFGASGFLTKNSPIDILTTAIRTVAGGGQYFNTDPS